MSVQVEPFAADSVTPYRILSLAEIESKLITLGVQRLMDDLRLRNRPPGLWGCVFGYAWLNSALDEMELKIPAIRSFVGSTHSDYVQEFCQLDTDRLKLAKDRCAAFTRSERLLP